ncbi:hypothetical protein DFH07DRAFT_968956 [Mycena maculata]|uniref:Transmembrane protein n=1 Tax=Mycena maculata TaxID=230809 RepID=A0AAD7HYI8_9AGAR|nr:hypothetical protein DFH07DRAFT_968956 [Mycena maculata]
MVVFAFSLDALVVALVVSFFPATLFQVINPLPSVTTTPSLSASISPMETLTHAELDALEELVVWSHFPAIAPDVGEPAIAAPIDTPFTIGTISSTDDDDHSIACLAPFRSLCSTSDTVWLVALPAMILVLYALVFAAALDAEPRDPFLHIVVLAANEEEHTFPADIAVLSDVATAPQKITSPGEAPMLPLCIEMASSRLLAILPADVSPSADSLTSTPAGEDGLFFRRVDRVRARTETLTLLPRASPRVRTRTAPGHIQNHVTDARRSSPPSVANGDSIPRPNRVRGRTEEPTVLPRAFPRTRTRTAPAQLVLVPASPTPAGAAVRRIIPLDMPALSASVSPKPPMTPATFTYPTSPVVPRTGQDRSRLASRIVHGQSCAPAKSSARQPIFFSPYYAAQNSFVHACVQPYTDAPPRATVGSKTTVLTGGVMLGIAPRAR